jgi:hypothetical protein
VLVAALAVLAAGLVFPLPGPAAAATAPITTLLEQLPVAAENSTGYDRDLFDHWIDEDGNGCDTREEVLIAESVVAPTTGSGCAVTGEWFSWYDGATWTDPSDVDIDHMVPLAEAWASGARNWTSAQRRAYANDLVIDESLAAVTDNVNQSKGDQDPAEWMPPTEAVHCRYATEWVIVKHRWNLAVDSAEAEALGLLLGVECGDPTVTVPPDGGTPDPVDGFSDVPTTHPFVDDIAWLVAAGVTEGFLDGTYRPGVAVSRQAMAAFLWRYTHGPDEPAPTCPQPWFPDVPTSSPMCGYVFWLAGTGIAGGFGDGTFRPGAPVGRQAMAAFLQRYREAEAPTAQVCDADLFNDMPSAPFCIPVTWLESTEITGGFPDGTFRPTAPVTRGAMAAFLHRYDDTFGPSDPPIVVEPPVVPPNPGDTKNCGDFATWAEAQAWFDLYFPWYGDVANLDANEDGVACESLPGAP